MADDADRRAAEIVAEWGARSALGQAEAAIAAAIREAVGAERERCAQTASRTCRLHPLFADGVLQEAIATNIRNPASPVPPAPAWTRTPPTVPGLYYHRDRRTGEVYAVRLVPDGAGLVVERFGWEVHDILTAFDGEWCGPIGPPA